MDRATSLEKMLMITAISPWTGLHHKKKKGNDEFHSKWTGLHYNNKKSDYNYHSPLTGLRH